MTATRAETQFPSYLSKKYCNDIALDFMTHSIDSLKKYRNKQLIERHRGGMNNIRRYIDQRLTWLQECDQYLNSVTKNRIFLNSLTTNDIFEAMNSVNSELLSLISGVTYSVNAGETPTDIAGEKFDRLFDLVENHKTLMLLNKGQLVLR